MTGEISHTHALPSYALRRAKEHDLAFASELIYNNMSPYYKVMGYQWDSDIFKDVWKITSNIIVTLPESQQRPIGVVRMHINEQRAVLWDLQLLPEYRGQGIGAQLIQTCIQISRNAGCPMMTLDVCKVNPAISLYQRAGFQPASETEHEIKMHLALT